MAIFDTLRVNFNTRSTPQCPNCHHCQHSPHPPKPWRRRTSSKTSPQEKRRRPQHPQSPHRLRHRELPKRRSNQLHKNPISLAFPTNARSSNPSTPKYSFNRLFLRAIVEIENGSSLANCVRLAPKESS